MSADTGNAFTLFIETGLHAGTVQRLSPGIYTLGSELDADIVLADQAIEDIHLIIELDGRGLRLEPLKGPIAVDGDSDSVEPGGERHLRFPASFSIGGTTIRMTAPTDAVRSHRRLRVAAMATGVAALAIVGFQILDPLADDVADGQTSLEVPLSGPAVERHPDDAPAGRTINALREQAEVPKTDVTDTDAAGTDVTDTDAAETAPQATLDQAAAALRERLAAEDFSEIEVKTAVDRIVVRGEAEPERMGAWRDIRIWFDGAFGQDYLLVAAVEPAENKTPPELAIEAVWSGDDPYLIAGGQRFFVGDQVGDGWAVDRILSDEITFRRGKRSFSLTL